MAKRKDRRLTEESLNDSGSERHKRGNFVSRKGLFAGSKVFGEKEIRILPDVARRGSNSGYLWYLSLAHHGFTFPNEDGNGTHFEGKICWEFLRTEQPSFLAEIIENTDYTDKDCRCFVCECLDAHKTGDNEWDEEIIPHKKAPWGQDIPEFGQSLQYGFPFVMHQDDYEDGDDHIVKIGLGTITMIKAIDSQMRKGGYFPNLLDPDGGNWVKFTKPDRKWEAQVNPDTEPIWFEGWSDVVKDGWLESQMPNLRDWTYDEQRDHFQEHYPGVFETMVEPPKTTKKAVKKKGKKS